MSKGKVLLGMSGGVDSSASAILLKEAGYEVIGATMILCSNEKCSTDNEDSSIKDAKKVCEKLNIPHYVIDCKDEFKKYVIDNFTQCYKCCITPNPCVECNKYLKFGSFYKKAMELECDYISTGHYAKVQFSEKYNEYVLKKSDAGKKDQTYFLYGINKEILSKMLFPLQNIENKDVVRNIAQKYNLQVSEKKDSQEICFIPDNDYKSFLSDKANIKQKKGNIVLKDGTILGVHDGLVNYTVGQRKGLGIAYKEPLYVINLNKDKNELVVGTEKELYSNELYAKDLNFLLDIDLSKPIEVMAKVRYRANEAKAIIKIVSESISCDKKLLNKKLNNVNGLIAKVTFEEPQRAITPGQSVVFYIDNVVVGGGKII